MKGALLVGIDHYAPPHGLAGCVHDAKALRERLAFNGDGSRNFECVMQVSSGEGESLTARQIDTGIKGLMSSEADLAFFHFSGHGAVDRPGGSALVAQDGSKLRLNDVVSVLAASKIRQKVVTLDCCFSGGIGADDFLADELSVIPQGVAILAASRSDQTAAESAGAGAFSSFVSAGLDGGAADVLGKITVASLYAYLDEAFGVLEQRPVMKANLTRLVELRQGEPFVPLSTLRHLPKIFGDPDASIPLDPSFEDTSEHAESAHVAVFKELQVCAAARLVEPIGERYMYFAAMNSSGCRLTPLGKRYWRMAHAGRL